MAAFFTPKEGSKVSKTSVQTGSTGKQGESKTKKISERSGAQRSVIFIPDVDVRFPEDRGFYAAVISLIHSSKCPVILTCQGSSACYWDDLRFLTLQRFHSNFDKW